ASCSPRFRSDGSMRVPSGRSHQPFSLAVAWASTIHPSMVMTESIAGRSVIALLDVGIEPVVMRVVVARIADRARLEVGRVDVVALIDRALGRVGVVLAALV